MSPDQAKRLMLTQEQLELAGWSFTTIPPFAVGMRWRFTASFGPWGDGLRATFSGLQRHDALAQALHYALMTEGTKEAEHRDTIPAPAMGIEAAE